MARFLPQGGTSRRYFDSLFGEYCSYRQKLKRSGTCPELKASERQAAGLSRPHKLRCDAGIPRRHYRKSHTAYSPSSRCETHLYTAHGYEVAVFHEPDSFRFLFIIAQAFPITITQVILLNRRRRFHCPLCPINTRKEAQMAAHVVERHYQSLQVSSVDVIRYRPSHERRARMPWRVKAPGYQ